MRAVFLLALTIAGWTASAIAPSWTYRVFKTEHFEIIFREDQRALAKRYAVAAEQAHALLFPIFKEGPSSTIVVLQDDSDQANGLATFFPYPHIVVFPVLPNQGDSIDEYGDWALEMMVHEYTHILNMYPAHGIYWPFKYILGSVARPNGILPRWYLEGLAVNLESRLTDFGRLRTRGAQAIARAYSLSDKFKTEDIATVNESDIKSFPYGGRPYLFGAWWWDEAHRMKGLGAIYELNQTFSRRLPFLINGPVRDQYGMSAHELLIKAGNRQAELAARQIDSIKAAGSVDAEVLEEKGDVGAFAISPSGQRMIYWLGLKDEGRFAYLRDRKGSQTRFKDIKPEKLFRGVGTYQVRWLDEDRIVFDQVDAAEPFEQFKDIYIYDLRTRKSEALTHGLRAQAPAASPDGKSVACIVSDGGRNALAVVDITTKSLRKVVQGNYWNRLSSPEFLDANQILFTVRIRKGDEKIYVYDVRTKKSRVWSEDLKSAQSLKLTQTGLLTTDGGTGVRNVYQLQNGKFVPITNSLTQIQFADYDPVSKNLVVQELTADGPRLKSQPIKNFRPPKVELPTIDAPPATPALKVRLDEKSFWPIEYLRPRYLIPALYPVEGGVIAQGITGAQDPIGRNAYQLAGSYDSITNKTSYAFNVLNQSFRTGIGAGYSDFITYLGASGRLIESQDANLNLSGNLGSKYSAWSLGGLWSQTEGNTSDYRRLGPTAGISYDGLNSPYHDFSTWAVELAHQQFLEQDGYLAYGHSYAHIANVLRFGRHKMAWQVRGAVSPDLPFANVVDLGDRSVGGNYLIDLTNSQFLLRGYPSGAFVGRKIVNGNLEWVFPGKEITRGFGTFPLFLRELDFAVFADTMAVDGGAFSTEIDRYVRSHLREFYTGTGAEFRFKTTAGYQVPLQFTLGLYYGLKTEYGGGFTPFLALGLGSLDPVAQKNALRF